jgi:Fur family ferric uptake transcriptional regulator
MERTTRQRQAIQQVIEAAGRPINAEEILAAASAQVPRLGIATVYRAVKALAQSGLVESVELAGEPARYEAAGKGHHDHFRCNSCERVFEVEHCPVKAARLPKGFVAQDHEVVFRGTCAECASKPGERARTAGR